MKVSRRVVAVVKEKLKYQRDKLNGGQIALLKLLYKYRFGTIRLIASGLGVNIGSSLYERLLVLEKYEYIARRKDIRSQALKNPIAYYLTAKGIKVLWGLPSHEYIGDQALRLSYQNKHRVSDGFVAHVLNIFEYTQRLKHRFPALKIFTARDMEAYRYFPETLPDAFLSLPSDDPDQPYRFFFDVVRDRSRRSVLNYKLTRYNEFFDEGEWDETGSPIPAILLVCEWSPDERLIQRRVQSLINRLGSEIRVFTTTSRAILRNSTNPVIWSDVNDIDEPISLEGISVNP